MIRWFVVVMMLSCVVGCETQEITRLRDQVKDLQHERDDLRAILIGQSEMENIRSSWKETNESLKEMRNQVAEMLIRQETLRNDIDEHQAKLSELVELGEAFAEGLAGEEATEFWRGKQFLSETIENLESEFVAQGKKLEWRKCQLESMEESDRSLQESFDELQSQVRRLELRWMPKDFIIQEKLRRDELRDAELKRLRDTLNESQDGPRGDTSF